VGALRLALIVSVEVAPPLVAVTGLGLKVALVLCGKPLTLKVTELEIFVVAVTVTVVGAFEPRLTVSEVGASEIVSRP
jgi:hypothetical protein